MNYSKQLQSNLVLAGVFFLAGPHLFTSKYTDVFAGVVDATKAEQKAHAKYIESVRALGNTVTAAQKASLYDKMVLPARVETSLAVTKDLKQLRSDIVQMTKRALGSHQTTYISDAAIAKLEKQEKGLEAAGVGKSGKNSATTKPGNEAAKLPKKSSSSPSLKNEGQQFTGEKLPGSLDFSKKVQNNAADAETVRPGADELNAMPPKSQ